MFEEKEKENVEKNRLKKEYDRPMANPKMKIEEDKAYEKLLKNAKLMKTKKQFFFVDAN